MNIVLKTYQRFPSVYNLAGANASLIVAGARSLAAGATVRTCPRMSSRVGGPELQQVGKNEARTRTPAMLQAAHTQLLQ